MPLLLSVADYGGLGWAERGPEWFSVDCGKSGVATHDLEWLQAASAGDLADAIGEGRIRQRLFN